MQQDPWDGPNSIYPSRHTSVIWQGNTSTTTTNADAPPGEVARIEDEVARLQVVINGLAERLAPVLRADGPSHSDNAVLEPATPIMRVRLTLSDEIDRLASISQRIDA